MPDTTGPALDLTRLERCRPRGQRMIARCPACAEDGGDRRAEHLVIFPDGKFACAAAQGDSTHRRRIFELAGLPREPQRNPRESRQRGLALAQARELQRSRAEEHEREQAQTREMEESARRNMQRILTQFPWEPADVWDDSPQRLDDPLVISDPRHFLATLYPPEAILWTGELWHSGPEHAARWRSRSEWQAAATPDDPGPMTCPAIWQPGSSSRTAAAVLASPYTVLDFDGADGVKPVTPQEKEAHLLASLAVIRWLREEMRWDLAAILHTGGKSLHAWFHSPEAEHLLSLRTAAPALGIDAGLIGRPEHCCRLPGQKHAGTGGSSRVLWLGKGK